MSQLKVGPKRRDTLITLMKAALAKGAPLTPKDVREIAGITAATTNRMYRQLLEERYKALFAGGDIETLVDAPLVAAEPSDPQSGGASPEPASDAPASTCEAGTPCSPEQGEVGDENSEKGVKGEPGVPDKVLKENSEDVAIPSTSPQRKFTLVDERGFERDLEVTLETGNETLFKFAEPDHVVTLTLRGKSEQVNLTRLRRRDPEEQYSARIPNLTVAQVTQAAEIIL